jgi:transposase-like protein
MPRRPRRNHSPAFRAKVALEAIKAEEPLIVITERFDVHPNQITKWKRQLQDGAAAVFGETEEDKEKGPSVADGGQNSTTDSLHGKIRFMYERLVADETFPLEIKHLSLVNRVSGAIVIGEAASPNAGRGGTFLYGLWDETASTEHGHAIYAAREQAVRCPRYLSPLDPSSNIKRAAPVERTARL